MAEIRQIQVDGVNYDLVISEDEVSATAAAQSAAQALAYKNQAQSSAAQAGQQATNASNQADRAEDAALRAEAIVGGEFVSYGQAQGLDDAQKAQARSNIDAANDSDVVKITAQTLTSVEQAQARANIMAGGSNDNLLDNAYFVGGGSQLGDGVFPINQRGLTSYPSSGPCIDRWRTDGGFTVSSSGVSQTFSTAVFQIVDASFFARLLGKTFTLSLLLTNGTIKSGQITLPNSVPASAEFYTAFNDGTHYAASILYPGGNGQLFRFGGNNIAAVKMEYGTVSTLANDVPPEVGWELAKCQRRLFRVSPRGTSSRGYAGFGSANSSKNILVFVPTPVTLAAQPTVSFSNCNAYNYVAGGSIAISSISIDSWTQNGVFLSCTPSDASQVVQYQPYVLRVAQGGYLQFSAEL